MKHFLLLAIYISLTSISSGKEFTISSPDKNIEAVLRVDSEIRIIARYQSRELFKLEDITLEIEGEDFTIGINKIKKAETNSISRKLYPQIKEKYREIEDEFNELTLRFRSDYGFSIRVFNEGIAYRFQTFFPDSLIVNRENLSLQLDVQDSLIFQKSATFNSSYETPYQYEAIGDVTSEGYCCLPALVKKPDGMNILILESDLQDYPGTWLKSTANSLLQSAHAGYPAALKYEGSTYDHGQVKTHEDYIARTNGNRSFPWRIFAISDGDAGLLSNTLVYQLAQPSRMEDLSWIEPGVVTFDWWGRRNIYGTQFKSGINTETAKYFIDFAATFGFEYFLFDDGWSKEDDLFAINPGLDMDKVMAYARGKNVKIMLWVIWNTFEKQEQMAWDQFEKWGISGIKFDFMNRDDQQMVQFYHHVAEEAAKRKMVIDFHGAYKPAGLRRLYPNVLTREALIEFEYNGWTEYDTPEHHNLLPYIRLVAGPADYIPFTTQNAQKNNFRPVGDMPMGQGTRAHSMALFVIMGSPMQMLPDSPSDYYREKECTEFISKIPVEWDDLKILYAKIREHTVLARKNGEDWYIGAITDWDPKEFKIVFDFLDDGEYRMEFIEDGINADTRAIDYLKKSQIISKGDSLNIKLAPGGGWMARLIKTQL
jgi:alpha-glucosidase